MIRERQRLKINFKIYKTFWVSVDDNRNATPNLKFAYWFSSNYATGAIYFQFGLFQYQNMRKLKLNILSNARI